MAKRKKLNPADYVIPMDINGMHGRMLRLPASTNKTREMLVVYGLHSSLERWFGIADYLSQYGPLTIPDLPGFGGMDSFYKIGEKPTLDNLADYLAAFIKLRYKRKKVTILAMSYGFVVATRMLQKYPDLTKHINLVVSLVGFVHHEDFRMKTFDQASLRLVSWLGYHKLPSIFIKTFVFRGPPIRLTYRLVASKHRKLHDADEEERKKRIDFEVQLWKINDPRTKGRVVYDMFKVDLCQKQVNLPVYHVSIPEDHFFDNRVVEQHMNIIYNNVTVIHADMDGHAPTVVADAKASAPFVPKKLRQLLSK